LGSLELNLSLSVMPITTSFTSGLPRRDTCTHAPPSTDGPFAAPTVVGPLGEGFSTRLWRSDAVVQPPMTGSLPAVRQLAGTSTASDVMFLSSMMLTPELRAPSGLRLI